MSRINMGRVVLGGLLAGLIVDIGESIFNMFVIRSQMEAALARLNLPQMTDATIIAFMVLGFALGIMTTWLYAAIRPRYGAGVSTALCAGAAVWFLAYVYPTLGSMLMGVFPAGLTAAALAWGLGEMLVAAVAGAWVYQERPATTSARV